MYQQRREHVAAKVLANGIPPLIALACGLLLIASRAPHGFASVLNPATFDRWDAGHYLAIARQGYFMRLHCVHGHYTPLPGHTCGDVTWFPGYPLLIRALSLTGIGLTYAGLILAWAFWYLTLLMAWLLSRPAPPQAARPWGTTTQWLCLLAAAFFPGQVYFAALAPVSMVAFGMLACCYWSARNPNCWLAAAAGLVAGSAYLPAVAVVPGLLVAAIVTRQRSERRAMCLAAAGVAAGLACVLAYAQAAVGRWDAYFYTERIDYGLRTSNPLATISARFASFGPMLSSGDNRAVAEQGILVALLLVLALAGFAASARRGAQAADIVLVTAAVAGWLIPYLAGDNSSPYRDEALTIVLVPLLRHLPAWKLAAPLMAAIWVAAGIATLFFSNQLR